VWVCAGRRSIITGSGSQDLEVSRQLGIGQTPEALDARRRPRFKLEVDICVYPRDCPVVRGQTVDISESGISAMLRVEVPVGEVVRLEFTLALGDVEVLALVRQRNAFRYGFQFVETSSAQDVIGRICRQLSVERSGGERPPSAKPLRG
jgi:PilZ domain